MSIYLHILTPDRVDGQRHDPARRSPTDAAEAVAVTWQKNFGILLLFFF